MDFKLEVLNFLHFINEYIINIIIAIVLFNKREPIFESLFLQPIRGGNGITQNDELAKYALICLLVWMVYIEQEPGEQYASEIFMFIAASVAGLAGLKRHYDHIKSKGTNQKESTPNNHSDNTDVIK